MMDFILTMQGSSLKMMILHTGASFTAADLHFHVLKEGPISPYGKLQYKCRGFHFSIENAEMVENFP